MTVTQILEKTNKQVKVYIDGEFAFVLYKGELRLYGVKEGADLPQDKYNFILEELLPKRAKLRCMNLLQSKEYTENELRRKLQNGDYPIDCINTALSYVKSFGYVDDVRYTTRYLECLSGRRSRKRIEMDLIHKGISKECIEEVFANQEDNILVEDEKVAIVREVMKRHYNDNTATFEERKKLFSYLYRKGFSIDLIKSVISDFDEVSGE